MASLGATPEIPPYAAVDAVPMDQNMVYISCVINFSETMLSHAPELTIQRRSLWGDGVDQVQMEQSKAQNALPTYVVIIRKMKIPYSRLQGTWRIVPRTIQTHLEWKMLSLQIFSRQHNSIILKYYLQEESSSNISNDRIRQKMSYASYILSNLIHRVFIILNPTLNSAPLLLGRSKIYLALRSKYNKMWTKKSTKINGFQTQYISAS